MCGVCATMCCVGLIYLSDHCYHSDQRARRLHRRATTRRQSRLSHPGCVPLLLSNAQRDSALEAGGIGAVKVSRGLQLQSLWRIPTAAVSQHHGPSESWPTAAIVPMKNPYCSCKLTLPARRPAGGRRHGPVLRPGGAAREGAGTRQSLRQVVVLMCLALLQGFAASLRCFLHVGVCSFLRSFLCYGLRCVVSAAKLCLLLLALMQVFAASLRCVLRSSLRRAVCAPAPAGGCVLSTILWLVPCNLAPPILVLLPRASSPSSDVECNESAACRRSLQASSASDPLTRNRHEIYGIINKYINAEKSAAF